MLSQRCSYSDDFERKPVIGQEGLGADRIAVRKIEQTAAGERADVGFEEGVAQLIVVTGSAAANERREFACCAGRVAESS